MRTVVIGASAAGGSLCETVRTLDPRAEITLITEEPLPLYSRCLLPLYVNGERTAKDLQFRRKAWAEELRLRVIYGRAVQIDPQGKTVKMLDGEGVGYDRLAVATGASPCQPAIPGIDAGGVFALYTLPGARAIKRWLPEAHKVIVLGAGLIGVKAAVALSELGKTVAVIEQRATVLPDTIDAGAARMVARLLTSHGVELLTEETVIEVIGGLDGKIEGVRVTSGDTVACDMLILAVGTQPNVEMLWAAGAAINRGVRIDEHLHTSLPHVYAAGDVAEVPRLGSDGMLPQANWLNARWEGRLAAYNMLGHDAPYLGRLRANAVRIFDMPLVSIGQISSPTGDDESLDEPAERVYRKLVFDNGCLKGLILVGDAAEAGPLTALIRQARDVGALRGRLLREGVGCLPDAMGTPVQKRTRDAQRRASLPV